MNAPADPQQTVFVVDDDGALREALASLFRSVGLQARTFASAGEFLQAKLPDSPTCLVLDVRLPGLSGLDFQAELAKANIDIPIVFMTGHGDIPMTVRAMKAGAVEFLPKPFRDQDMLDAVQQALERDRNRRKSGNDHEPVQRNIENSRLIGEEAAESGVDERGGDTDSGEGDRRDHLRLLCCMGRAVFLSELAGRLVRKRVSH